MNGSLLHYICCMVSLQIAAGIVCYRTIFLFVDIIPICGEVIEVHIGLT